MTRFRLIAALSLVALLLGAWGLYAVWPTPRKFPIAIPPKPAIHAEWPVIDCGNKSVANSRLCPIPRTNSRFLLKVKLKNIRDPGKGFFIAFYPERGTEDAKKNWYYGGAMVVEGHQTAGIWEFEGEARVCTYRDQRMRAVLKLPGETELEVLVEVEGDTKN